MKKLDKDKRKTLIRLMNYILQKYKFSFLLVIVFIIITALTTIKGTIFMQSLIDDYIIPMSKISNPDFFPLIKVLIQLSIIYSIGIISSYLSTRIMVVISQGVMRDLRIDLFSHMESLPIKYFDTNSHGDIMSVYTNDVDTLRQLISQSIPQTINSIITISITFVSMIILDLYLTIISVIMVVIMLFITSEIGKKTGRFFVKQQKNLGNVNGFIEEMIEGQKVIKVFCHEQNSIKEFEKINDLLRESAYNANKFANIMIPINVNLANMSYVFCSIIGSIFALTNFTTISLGTLVSFLALNKGFTQPIIQLTQQMNSVIMGMAGADRIFKLFDEVPEEDDGYVELVNIEENNDEILSETDQYTGIWAWKHFHKSNNNITYTKLKGEIIFNNVNFGYNNDNIVLHNIQIFAKPGQKIAFVGSTGAGKTTITNLINRFYDIREGKIRYDGININKIKKSDLRRSLGIVLQDTNLFTDTVINNIRYGKLDATDDECISAAILSNADSFIKKLPQGYNTMLTGNGKNLSQGQRQLIAIARAAVANPPVLVLDEATSSIDTRTETLVQQGMDRLMKGRTTFVIAHRLSTVRNSDCIIVFEKGKIIEKGTHEELLLKKGKYYELYNGNFVEE